jgi:hypothetical protein
MLNNILSIPSFFRAFIMTVLNFVKGFFLINWEDHMAFVLVPVYMLYYIYSITHVDPFLYPWNET